MRKAYFTFFVWIWIGISTYAQNLNSVERYIEQHKQIAIEEMHRTGIPASITLAQAIVASNYGNNELVSKGNNHFNQKCLHGWRGGKLYRNGQLVSECYRVYNNANESFKDHTSYLMDADWYAALFLIDVKNYQAWAVGLHNAGYDASNPYYGQQLIQLIEDYQLFQLDAATPYESVIIARGTNQPIISPQIQTPSLPSYNSQEEVVNNRVSPHAQVITNIHEFDFNYRPIENDLLNLEKELTRQNPQAEREMMKRFRQTKKIIVTPLKQYNETSNRKTSTNKQYLKSLNNSGRQTNSTTNEPGQFFLAARLQYVPTIDIIYPDSVTPNKGIWELAAARRETDYKPLHTLYNFDNIKEKPLSKKTNFTHNRSKAVRYDYAVSAEQIANTYDKELSKLLNYNDLQETAIFPAYINIYLQKKKKKAKGKRHHRVKKGDSMWKIAQYYGVQLDYLYKRNLLFRGQEPREEEVVLLRGKAVYPPKITSEKSEKKQEYKHKRGDPAGIHYTKKSK